jgi:hypothetical protein
VTAVRDLLHWLVDHAEAHPGDRGAAHQLVDQAHPPEADPEDTETPAGTDRPEPGGEGT